jgi:hypothetical protein
VCLGLFARGEAFAVERLDPPMALGDGHARSRRQAGKLRCAERRISDTQGLATSGKSSFSQNTPILYVPVGRDGHA